MTFLLDASVSRYRRPLKIRDFVWEIKYWDLRSLNNVKSNFSFNEINKKDLSEIIILSKFASRVECVDRKARLKHKMALYVYVVVNFLSQVVSFIFSFVSTSLAYITIPRNKGKLKITCDKKSTTTYFSFKTPPGFWLAKSTSTWSYENRVSKHLVIILNFPCLIACLLCCLNMSFFLLLLVLWLGICVEVDVDRITILLSFPSPILCLTQVTVIWN